MKAWLVAAAKFLAEFLIMLCLLAAGGAFAADLASPSLQGFAGAAAREALRLWPLALALCVSLGIVGWRIAGGSRLGRALSVCLLGGLLAMAGTGIGFLVDLEDIQALAEIDSGQPATGRAIETGERTISVEAVEGDLARGVVAVDFAAPFPRLAWHPTARFDGKSSSLRLGPSDWIIQRSPHEVEGKDLRFLSALPLPLSGKEAPIAALGLALAFVLLCVGLSLPALGLRWPLAALTFALFATALALFAEHWLAGGATRQTLADDLGRLGLSLDPALIVACLEALAGLAVGAIGLLVWRKEAG